ncbi:outer membrane protein assembly factor BamA [Balneicella halophila]|uniref:Outer membrane protein assembly factor BamA n=1 Tax=Balneicella halophila TaxID=1537566 RepID=A0A7L4URT0_BALHA|nr:BamA/TamA family outer membrane protein [Balneicella halophila]PVX52359.1 outer membrane protein assembly factor BamA [Balneicella halophila]
MKKTIKYILLLLSISFVFACSTTKYVSEDEFLLTKVKIDIDDKRVAESKAEAYVKQKPNNRILGEIPFNVWMYNLSGSDSTKKINRFLRKLGEAPVIYDSIQTHRTLIQLERFMANKGFYDAEIEVRENFSKKKVKVNYIIKANEPKVIANIIRRKDSLLYKVIGKENMRIELPDSSSLRQTLIQQKKKAFIRKNDLLDVDKLKEERERLEALYELQGYFNFDEDNIHFYLDTTKLNNKVDIYYGLRTVDSLELRKYKIRKITVYLDIEAQDKGMENKFDSIKFDDITFFYKDKMSYKPFTLARAILIKEGQLYSPENVDETKRRLGILKQFKYSNVGFREFATNDSIGLLDCYIQLVSQKRQSYSVEATATVNAGDFGFATNLRYQHKNLFRGAELFTVQLSAGIERLRREHLTSKFDASEFGATVNLISPKFYLPFFKVKNWRARVPRTSTSIVYNYAERPEYLRTITDLTFSYQWRSNDHFSHIFTPIDLGLLKVNADPDFLENLNNYYRQTSYVDHIIPSMRYSLRFDNQGKTRKTTYQRARFNVESSGNLLNAIDHLMARNDREDLTENDYFSYFGIRYAQYIRSDIEFTYNQFINPKHALIYHIFLGAGFPYGNSEVMPFEKMYFAGGPNSMRAWHPRSLGPGGSRANPPNLRLSYGEFKLEGNLEYRFSLAKSLEGALFVDAGNVWNLSDLGEKDPDSKFEFDSFYKQIAVGTGLGLRYDISNIILRLDAGIKLVDPYLQGDRFVPKNSSYDLKDITFNFGIGYPF